MKKQLLLILALCFCLTNGYSQTFERYKKLNDTTLTSTNLPHNKSISIYVPIEWQKDIEKTYPLTILFDRQNKGIEKHIVNTIDFLTATSQMPSTVIISINSERNKRFLETNYLANSSKGLAEKNKTFLFDELIPFAKEQLKTNSFNLFIGHSRYGYFVSDLFANHIDKVNAVIAIEPFFTNGNVNLLKDFDSLSTKTINTNKYFRYTIGRDSRLQFNPTQEVIKNIKNEKVNASGKFFPEVDHFAIPALTVSNALYDVFEFWSKQQNVLRYEDVEFNKLEALQKEVKMHYGENLSFSFSALYGIGFTFFYKTKEYNKAIKTWNALLEQNPNFSEAYLNIIKAQKKLNIDTKDAILKFKKSLEKSTFYSKERKAELLDSLK